MNGPYKSWFGADTISAEGMCKDGLKDGHWIWYYENGKKRTTGEMHKDKRKG